MFVRPKLFALLFVGAIASGSTFVHGQVFTDDDFSAGDYDTFTQGNNDIRFAFDYSSIDIFGDGFITASIPEAPNSNGGATTTGVFLSVNNDSTVTATDNSYAAIFPKLSNLNGGAGVGTGTATPNFRVKLDVFGSTGAGVLDSVNGTIGDGDDTISLSGTTNKVHIGINHANPADVALEAVSMSLDPATDASFTGSAPSGSQGLGFGYSPDTGASEDYYGVYGGYQYTYRGGRPRSIADGTATTTGRTSDFINEFWVAEGSFELVDSDEDATNDLTIFTGNSTYFSPDPSDPASFDGGDASSGVRLYADNLSTTPGAPHYTVSDANLQTAGFGANSRLLNNEENRPLDFPENNDDDPENDVTSGLDLGTAFNTWSEHEILYSDEIMTYTIDGLIVAQMAVADIADPVSTAGTIMLAYYDRFSSVAGSPEGANFVIYDNLVVEAAGSGETPDLEAHLVGLGILPGGGEPADLNNDGFVDGLDLGILLGNFDSVSTPDMGELNGTDPVDGLDLGILLGAWNPPASLSAAAVPEPTSLVLLAMVGVSLLTTRSRNK